MPTTVLFLLYCCLRTQHLQHEDARRYQLTIAAEDAAAQASVRKELMASQLAVEDQTNKVRDCAGPGCVSAWVRPARYINKLQDCAGPGVFQLGLDQQGAGLCRCMCVSASVQK